MHLVSANENYFKDLIESSLFVVQTIDLNFTNYLIMVLKLIILIQYLYITKCVSLN